MPAGERPALALPDKPSLAVLPFQNLSGDPEQEYFADGMIEDIMTALSPRQGVLRHRPQLGFTYRAGGRREADRPRARRALHLEGSVRKRGDRVRITGQLIDAETGAHLWADRYDGALADVFELQDRVDVERRRGDRTVAAACGNRASESQADREPRGVRLPAAGDRLSAALHPRKHRASN